MSNPIGKHLLKLLLVVIMSIQPAVFSYAMADMARDMAQTTQDSMDQVHDLHMDHQSMHGQMMDTQQDHSQQHSHKNGGNCCDSSACCPVAVFEIDIELNVPTAAFPAAVDPSLQGIDPNTETKPPRPIWI